MILTRILDTVMDQQGEFDIVAFRLGRQKQAPSYARLVVKGRSMEHLQQMLDNIYEFGGISVDIEPARLEAAPWGMALPRDFYSTTNNPTHLHLDGEWIEVEGRMTDKAIIVDRAATRAVGKPIREVQQGDFVVVGTAGVKVAPPERSREGTGIFEFMSSRSSEKPVSSIATQIAKDIIDT